MRTRIKELRQEKKFTQESLALRIGASQTALSKMERGIRIPDASDIIHLSKMFQVSTDYILCLSDYRISIDDLCSYKYISLKKFIYHFQKLNQTQRKYLLYFIISCTMDK